MTLLAIAGVACASNTMQPSSPTITPELGSPSAVKAYRSVPTSEKVIFFSAISVVDAKPLAINSTFSFCHCEEPLRRSNRVLLPSGSLRCARDDGLKHFHSIVAVVAGCHPQTVALPVRSLHAVP